MLDRLVNGIESFLFRNRIGVILLFALTTVFLAFRPVS